VYGLNELPHLYTFVFQHQLKSHTETKLNTLITFEKFELTSWDQTVFSFCPTPTNNTCCVQLQEESIEEVIKDTESLFQTREKEYQDTIDQIEVRHLYSNGVQKSG